jgi:hypothetical protein
MKITNMTSVATILSILSFCKAPGVGRGIRRYVVPQQGWVGTQEARQQIQEEMQAGWWTNPQYYDQNSVEHQHLNFPVGATVSYGAVPNMIYITNQVNVELEYLMESLDRSQYALFTLPPNQQDLVPGNAATIWVRVRHN